MKKAKRNKAKVKRSAAVKKRKVQPIPAGYHEVTPYLSIRGAAQAIEFYKKAFGALEVMRMPGPEGKLGHAEIRIGGSRIMLSDEYEAMQFLGPESRGGHGARSATSGTWRRTWRTCRPRKCASAQRRWRRRRPSLALSCRYERQRTAPAAIEGQAIAPQEITHEQTSLCPFVDCGRHPCRMRH